MVTLFSDKDLSLGYQENIRFMELYIDTDVFYKLFYIIHQMGLDDYFTFDVDQNGRGVYVRITKREGNLNEIC